MKNAHKSNLDAEHLPLHTLICITVRSPDPPTIVSTRASHQIGAFVLPLHTWTIYTNRHKAPSTSFIWWKRDHLQRQAYITIKVRVDTYLRKQFIFLCPLLGLVILRITVHFARNNILSRVQEHNTWRCGAVAFWILSELRLVSWK